MQPQGFSDHNSKWLKPKQLLTEDGEDEDQDGELELPQAAAYPKKVAAKQAQLLTKQASKAGSKSGFGGGGNEMCALRGQWPRRLHRPHSFMGGLIVVIMIIMMMMIRAYPLRALADDGDISSSTPCTTDHCCCC